VPKNAPIKPDHCLKFYKLVYKEENGRLKFSNQHSNSNCYLLYTKSFESQIEAKEFCRTAFGEKYIGELAYGIGIDLYLAYAGMSNTLHNLLITSKWKYIKSGTLKKINDFTCQTGNIYKNYFDFIGVKKDIECSLYKKIGQSEKVAIYNISTICEISGKM
jgi:hypothetical protein